MTYRVNTTVGFINDVDVVDFLLSSWAGEQIA